MQTCDVQTYGKPARSQRACWQSSAEAFPFATFFLSAVAILFQFQPRLSELMAFDRAEIATGQWWRLLTGHFTHYSADHLTWDVLMFTLLGATIERRGRRCLLAVLVGSAALISLALWCGPAQIEHYRGLSGIDSALFTFVVLTMLHDARRSKQSLIVWTLVALAAGFAAKIVWELATGSTLFVDSGRAGFIPLPLVHAVGGVVGIASAALFRLSTPGRR